jgi:hypothetical protein
MWLCLVSRRCHSCVPGAPSDLHLHHTGSGDETRLLANEFGSEKKNVNVYWHVLKEGDAYSQGNIPRDAINKQIDVLNDRFSPSHIQFNVSTHHCLSPAMRNKAEFHSLIPFAMSACMSPET